MKKEVIQKILQKHSYLRDKLFCRGYVITNSIISEKDYPFYGLWIKRTIDEYTLLVSPKQHSYIYKGKQGTWVLIGHAYNPVTMDSDEMTILKKMDEANDFINVLNELTGVFTLHALPCGRPAPAGTRCPPSPR